MTEMTDVGERTYDAAVVDGGVAGICAATSAADRSGASVAYYVRETGLARRYDI